MRHLSLLRQLIDRKLRSEVEGQKSAGRNRRSEVGSQMTEKAEKILKFNCVNSNK